MMTTTERPGNDQYPADTACVTVMTASQPRPPPGRTTSHMLSAAPHMMETGSPGESTAPTPQTIA
eukprot:6412910-Prymnesium_polylepis.1